jgi:hypothetical protein
MYQPTKDDLEVRTVENISDTTDDYFLIDETSPLASPTKRAGETTGPTDSDSREDGRSFEGEGEGDDGEDQDAIEIVIHPAFHKVSSLDCISADLRHEEPVSEKGDSPSALKGSRARSVMPKVSSLDIISAEFKERGQGQERSDVNVDSEVETQSGVQVHVQEASFEEPMSLNSIDCSEPQCEMTVPLPVPHPNDDEAMLQFCVPLPHPVLLVNRERQSRGRNRGEKSLSSATIAIYSTIMLLVFVLVDRYCGAYVSMGPR